ncbi:MAG: urease accessory protein UreF [Desulfobacteraceae bacterium]|jgi:urease accessory protein
MAAATTIDAHPDIRLLRLMQLVSPTLPVGAFAYSQGLEWAVESGWVSNARQTLDWIAGVLHHGQAKLDIPILARLYRAWHNRDRAEFGRWDRYLAAARGTAELQQEDRLMGQALHRLFNDLTPGGMGDIPCKTPSFTAMFAVAACNWGIDLDKACTGLLWAWAENQIGAAVKLVPLGQTQGQTILMQIAGQIPGAVKTGLAMKSDEIGAVTPALSMACAKHETQHTRLFRS